MKRPGMMIREVLSSFLKKTATITYPAMKVEMPDRFRGRIIFHNQRCIGCKLCVRDCPSEAITINKIGEKQFEAIIDLDRCVYCAQCVDSCNKDALESSKDYELASLVKTMLKVYANVDGPYPPVAAPAAEAAPPAAVAPPAAPAVAPPAAAPGADD
jgi:formate hydrogenlyase subunit 6/NADH:ubiquinone oxidoreductase subunit I